MRVNFELARNIVDIFPGDLRAHSYNVCYLSVRLAEYIGLKNEKMRCLAIGALLHDIGKTQIDEEILNKPGKLTDKEFAIVKKHTVIGSDLIKSLNGDHDILPIIRYHHERWDGAGYERLKENEIPELAQIVTIADAFDAMTTNRPYQEIKTLYQTLNELNKNKGRQFSPNLVEKFEACIIELTKRTSSDFYHIGFLP